MREFFRYWYRAMNWFIIRDTMLALSYRFNMILQAGAWLFTLFLWYFIAALMDKGAGPFAQGGGYFPYVILGLALQGILTTLLYGASSRIREQQMNGTLEYTLNLLLVPAVLPALSMVSDVLFASIRMVFILIGAQLIFSVKFLHMDLAWAVASLTLSVVAFWSIGNLAAASVLLFKRGEPVSMFVGTVSALFGTVFFPKEVLPPALQHLSDLIPTTHALNAVRGAFMDGKGFMDLTASYAYLLIFCAIMMPLSLWLFNAAVRRAKRDGSLGQY